MDLASRVEQMIEPMLSDLGYDLVRVVLSGKTHPTLQVMAERADGVGMMVDDCAIISRAISALLDVEDPIEAAYDLEVSSPGIDRPLVRERDYQRFAGFDVRVELNRVIDGRRRFKGKLLGVADGTVNFKFEGGTLGVPLSDIHKAKLVLTDELLKAAQSDARN
jgi:ribosome maturation factor RimP